MTAVIAARGVRDDVRGALADRDLLEENRRGNQRPDVADAEIVSRSNHGDRRIIPRRMYKWTLVGLLWLVCFFNYADRQAIYSVFPLLQTEMGADRRPARRRRRVVHVVYAAAAPLAGLAGDRFARKTIVIGGLIFWSLITVATALSTR